MVRLETYIVRSEESIESFSRKAGVGRSTVARLLRGRPATLRVAQAVSKATDGQVSVMTLLEGRA